ncbi:MAG: hypothetical protein SGARI_002736, partial [Bacillariaceae sp.]
AIARAADATKSYALPVDLLKGTMLESFAESDGPTVVEYECVRFSFEEFGTVAKILLRSYVQESDIKAHAECLDYFGPFKLNNLFVSMALEPKDDEATPPRKKQARLKSDNDEKQQQDEPMDVIVCENESRTKVVCEVARQLGEPYVPFKMLWIEGIMQSYDGDDGYGGATPIEMMPMALLVGDYNNIFCLRQAKMRKYHLGKIHEKKNYWSEGFQEQGAQHLLESGNALVRLKDGFAGSNEDTESDYDESAFEAQQNSQLSSFGGLSLKLAFGETSFQTDLMKFVFDDPSMDKTGPIFRVLPGNGATGEYKVASDLFHRDEDGKAVFTSEEADKASEFISNFGLEERVLAAIRLQQSSAGDPDTPLMSKEEFDAWPDEANKMNPYTYRKEGWDFMYPEHPQNDWMLEPDNDYVQALGMEVIQQRIIDKYGNDYAFYDSDDY